MAFNLVTTDRTGTPASGAERGSPLECPNCGSERVRRGNNRRDRPDWRGGVLVRGHVCLACGFRARSGQFWIVGEYLSSISEDL